MSAAWFTPLADSILSSARAAVPLAALRIMSAAWFTPLAEFASISAALPSPSPPPPTADPLKLRVPLSLYNTLVTGYPESAGAIGCRCIPLVNTPLVIMAPLVVMSPLAIILPSPSYTFVILRCCPYTLSQGILDLPRSLLVELYGSRLPFILVEVAVVNNLRPFPISTLKLSFSI